MSPREFLDLMDELLVGIAKVEADPQIRWNMYSWVEGVGDHCEVCLAGAWMLERGQRSFLAMPYGMQRTAFSLNRFRRADLGNDWPFEMDRRAELQAYCAGCDAASYWIRMMEPIDIDRMVRKIDVAKAAVRSVFGDEL